MINSEIRAMTDLGEKSVAKNSGVHIVVTIGLVEAQMAVNDEMIRQQLAEKVGEIVTDEVESYLGSEEGRDKVYELGKENAKRS